ncbi:MAG: GAF domain-containing sensor histidine kinase, partial [Actinobacteria bacterium]|nr:GAF domain-containing sensor histidine kinase [Actinomycetota bacterium]
LGIAGMGVLALGAAIQVGWGQPGSTVAAYLHLGEIFAYPLLAMAAVRSLVAAPSALPAPTERAEPLPPTAALPMDGVVALTGLMAARTVDQLASRLVEALARAIRVEYCLLITPPDPRGDFAIAAGFDLIRDRQVHGTSLDDRRCPSLGGAITRGETYLLTPEHDGQDLKHLKSKLNLIAVGPGLVVPIRTDESVHGALLLLSPYGHRQWSQSELDAARKIASNLATRLAQMKSRAGPLRAVASAASVDAPRPESEHIERLAGELQLALQELAELRARVSAEEKQVPPGPNTEAITALAQELRQPLSSMLGYTDLLLGDSVGRLGATQRQFVERVRSGVERMRTLLSDLVQITAIETGELNLTPAPIDLLRCVEEAVTQAAPSLREKDLGLRMNFPNEVPALLGDEAAVIQILVHLINNASGASPEGAEIGLSAQLVPGAPSGFLLISVSDRGEGIAPEDFGRVFEPVYRAEFSLLGGLGDSGAGLALVKALSEEMGGRVWIESEQAGGSTLSVLLPLADQAIAGELQPVA